MSRKVGKYIKEEELKKLIDSCKNKYLIEVIEKIYYDGLSVKEAINKYGNNISMRTFQFYMEKLSNKNICLTDFRYTYFINNPEVFFNKRREFYNKRNNISNDKRRLKIRYELLKKANFKCEFCGKSSKEARLEIDHKIPVAKGGTNEIDNLQILCSECNLGKGDLL